jgi:hypothetical protein
MHRVQHNAAIIERQVYARQYRRARKKSVLLSELVRLEPE